MGEKAALEAKLAGEGDIEPAQGIPGGQVPFMILEFLWLASSSLVIGTTFGLMAALILKWINLNDFPVKEVCIMLMTAFVGYTFAEHFNFSGIITMFSAGFTMAHYAYYNLSKEAKKGSSLAIEAISALAEAFLYCYIGISALSIKSEHVVPEFVVAITVATAIGRFISVFLPITVIWLC